MFHTFRLSCCRHNIRLNLIRCVNELSQKTVDCHLPVNCHRFYSDSKINETDESDAAKSRNASIKTLGKYQVFRDIDAPVILDVDEERWSAQSKANIEPEVDEFEGINLERGVHGVYDLEDLVELLRRDNANDIFVVAIPPEMKYVDYIVIVTGKSRRHMRGMAEFVRMVYKRKSFETDVIPHIEGAESADWMALDLGNIALHIFSRGMRPAYDLETLWSVGSKYDSQLNAPEDPLVSLLKKHAFSLDDFEPADTAR